MPQMFPINWLILYSYFMLLFMILIINNYFFSKMINKKSNKIFFLKSIKFNWKW